jgi:2-polyprenyl-6-methoxyphenol hydroxylase-like FAD-dependent oxidoreductase
MKQRTVLISGAGIAGPVLAYWLAQHGWAPTVVERGGAIRSSGSPVDVRRQAVVVAAQMGVLDAIHDARTGATGLTFVTPTGRRSSRVDLRALARASGRREVELPRGDLAAILYAAARDRAEFVFEDSIATLDQDEGGVDVTFERTAPGRFDLVIGADGLHSRVRRLVFGPERDFVEHMGMYIATVPLAPTDADGTDILMYNAPGRSLAIHPGRVAAFFMRRPALVGFDHRDTAQHRRLLAETFGADGWRVSEVLDRVRTSDGLYFDSVSRVSLPRWSRGRTVLVGDAASCVSLFGDGSTLAMAGGYALAEELALVTGDPGPALARYEARHRVLVNPRLRGVATAATLLVPATGGGIAIRNLVARLWPVAAAGIWVGARFRRVSVGGKLGGGDRR